MSLTAHVNDPEKISASSNGRCVTVSADEVMPITLFLSPQAAQRLADELQSRLDEFSLDERYGLKQERYGCPAEPAPETTA